MEFLLKAFGLALVGSCLILLLQPSVPSVAMVLGVLVAIAVLLMGFGLLREILDFLLELAGLAGISQEILQPVLKALGIGLLTHIAAGLCKDTGQSGIAACVTFVGTIAGLWAVLPLLRGVVEMLRVYM